jgi:hypothetical protein
MEHDWIHSSFAAASDHEASGHRFMSIVHLPICPLCKWMMRQVRVSEGDHTPRVRVFECMRCHTEMIWTPGVVQRVEVVRGKSRIFDWFP